ncbi:MAG: HlyC/CorC family transporter [Phycisphaerae bacterium]|nr:HlyC/CorC family transporter [Phycisphaerae bacterium]
MIPFWITLILLAMTCCIAAVAFSLRHLSRAKLGELVERRGRAKHFERLLKHLGEITLMTAALRMATNLLIVLLIAYILKDSHAESLFHFGSVFIIAAALILVFGVAIPNAWAKYAGEPLLFATMPLLNAAQVVFRPLGAFLHLFDGIVRRLAGVPLDNGQNGAEQAEQEILNIVSEGEAQGGIDEEEKDMIESVMQLDEMQVGEIMTPRTEMVALPSTATLFEAKDLITREGYSRIPVYEESLDHVIGVLYAKDLLHFDRTDDFDVTKVMRKVPFVPETKPLRDLLREFRQNKVQLALVLDEYGGTAGLVTIEDIVEELVGDIVDEFEPPEPEPIRRIDDDTLEIDARLHVDELNDELDIELPEDDDYETVGGFVSSALGKIPAAGEELNHGNVHIRVLAAEERRINRLRVHVTRQREENEAKDT